jgi:hypothetical protein
MNKTIGLIVKTHGSVGIDKLLLADTWLTDADNTRDIEPAALCVCCEKDC